MARVSKNVRREQLVAAGMQIMETDGLPALSVRKVAAEAGTSTMAVYTHFGGMTGLLDAMASETFVPFTKALTGVTETDDPVADFFAMGIAYHHFALENPQRYQFMFGIGTPASLASHRTDLTVTGRATDRAEWSVSFEALQKVVRRMIRAGRIRDDGELIVAGRLWSITHGAVTLEMAGFFGHEGHGLLQILGPLTVDVLVGLGDQREKTLQSLASVMALLEGT
jgi:AcrR family transcriptional regulator